MQPTIFDVKPEMTLAQEEVLGAILSIIPFDDEADALRIANGTDTVWLPKSGRTTFPVLITWFAANAGVVHVNTYGGADGTVPMGGVR